MGQPASPRSPRPPGPQQLDIWEPRRAILDNLHTGEKFNEVYYANGSYLPDALAEATRVMRDWRTGDEHFIDPGLFDALHAISGRLETRAPVPDHLRLPLAQDQRHAARTLQRRGDATASTRWARPSTSACEGVELSSLRSAALDLGAGGVGYYPVSNFVHVDTGRVRQWRGA